MRPARAEGKPAEHGHVQVRMRADHMFPVREIESFLLQRFPEFHGPQPTRSPDAGLQLRMYSNA
jgi:hypothetical protein